MRDFKSLMFLGVLDVLVIYICWESSRLLEGFTSFETVGDLGRLGGLVLGGVYINIFFLQINILLNVIVLEIANMKD